MLAADSGETDEGKDTDERAPVFNPTPRLAFGADAARMTPTVPEDEPKGVAGLLITERSAEIRGEEAEASLLPSVETSASDGVGRVTRSHPI